MNLIQMLNRSEAEEADTQELNFLAGILQKIFNMDTGLCFSGFVFIWVCYEDNADFIK